MEFTDPEFQKKLNQDIAERVFDWQLDPNQKMGRPLYQAASVRARPVAHRSTFIWAHEEGEPAVPINFANSWGEAGYVIGKLFPAMHPAQFLAEVLAACNWTPMQNGTLTLSPLESGNLFAQFQGDGTKTQFGIFCDAYPQVPPALWRHILEHLGGLALTEITATPFWDDFFGGLNYLADEQNWLRMFANAQNNPVPE